MTTWRTGLNIECKTFIRTITYQNKVVHPSQAMAASPISGRYCFLYSSLHFSCRKQTGKCTLEQFALLLRAESRVWSRVWSLACMAASPPCVSAAVRRNPADTTRKSFIKREDSAKTTHTNETEGMPSQVRLKTTVHCTQTAPAKLKHFSKDWETH